MIKQLLGYSGYYISDDGKVFSRKRRGSGNQFLRNWLIERKLVRDKDGYLRVGLYEDGKARLRGVHQLVAEAFIGPCPSGMQVMHKNDIRHDNRAENLFYGTPAQNSRQMIDHGRSLVGVRHPRAKITERTVKNIRDRVRSGFTQKQTALDFGVSLSTVKAISQGRQWKHVS